MKETTKVLMKYYYHQLQKEKCVTLKELADWIATGRYAKRVRAVRGLDEIAVVGGMVSDTLAAEKLPYVCPAVGEKGAYTGWFCCRCARRRGRTCWSCCASA